MKCPLLKIARAGLISEAARPLDDCLKEECAWWSQKSGRCVVLACEEACNKLEKTLKDISSKIPLGGAK